MLLNTISECGISVDVSPCVAIVVLLILLVQYNITLFLFLFEFVLNKKGKCNEVQCDLFI